MKNNGTSKEFASLIYQSAIKREHTRIYIYIYIYLIFFFDIYIRNLNLDLFKKAL